MSDDPERATRRSDLGVPAEAASCHTAVVDGYVVEGHVPIEALERLLADRPDALGLALPGMPSDSPGMGGDQTTWRAQRVLQIDTNGNLEQFDF